MQVKPIMNGYPIGAHDCWNVLTFERNYFNRIATRTEKLGLDQQFLTGITVILPGLNVI